MNDDYLWDRSGEPDPEIEQLEQALSKYRYQSRPVSAAMQTQLTVRRTGWIRLAAIAAAVLVALAGFWLFKIQTKPVTTEIKVAGKENPPAETERNQPPKIETSEAPVVPNVAATRKPPRKVHRNAMPETKDYAPLADSGDQSTAIAMRVPITNPFIDPETAQHIERAQILLRSFRNTRDSGKQADPDLSYEKQQSRGLLSKNILLRRYAESKRNMPAEELLGSLEPFLLDIANLPDKPSNDEVRAIKERMQKKEIVSALQVYSAPMLSEVF